MSEQTENINISEQIKPPRNSSFSTMEKIFIVLSVLGVIVFPLLLIACFRVVNQYKRAVVLRFGRVRSDSPAGPGIIWVLPFTDEVTMIDLRTQSFHLPPQQILTKDSVTVTVDAVGYFHIMEPLHCLLKVQYYRLATELITIAMLRNVLGQYTLADALASRQSMSARTKAKIDAIASDWGIHIERVEIKNILLPFDLQAVMAVEAEATRIAKAKVIEAEGEIQAAENLREASRIIMENPQIMLLHDRKHRLYSHFRLKFLITLHLSTIQQSPDELLNELKKVFQPANNDILKNLIDVVTE